MFPAIFHFCCARYAPHQFGAEKEGHVTVAGGAELKIKAVMTRQDLDRRSWTVTEPGGPFFARDGAPPPT
ncbi:hypothetical protein NL676_032840 [Syzygium grande]|nr:hypothetical protein NL676_032840 [Syzygium grande]